MAAATAMSCGLDLALVGAIGGGAGTVGLITGLFINHFALKTKDTWREPEQNQKTIIDMTQEVNRSFAKANQEKVDEIVKVFELPEHRESNAKLTDAQLIKSWNWWMRQISHDTNMNWRSCIAH